MTERQYTRPLLRPEWRTWSDVIASARIVDFDAKPKYQSRVLHTWRWRETYYTRTDKKRTRAAEMPLSSFMSIDGAHVRRGLDIDVTQACLETITASLLTVEYDTINLESHMWPSGETLITYHHSRIIGGRWIAVIDTASIPTEIRSQPPTLELVP